MLDKQKHKPQSTVFKEDDTVANAIADMNARDIKVVIVHDNDGRLAGLFTESDFMRMCASHGSDAMKLSLKDAMSKDFVWVSEKDTALDAMHVLCDTRFRHLPVCDHKGNELRGIISIDDIIRLVASERRRAVEFYTEHLISTTPDQSVADTPCTSKPLG